MDSPGDFREGLAQVIHHVAVHGAAHAQKPGQRKFWKGAEKLAGHIHGQGKVEPAISRSDFEKGLSRFFQPPADGHIRPKRLRDAEFRDIAQWCISYGKDDWGRRPRTFFILRMIGCEEALDGFVEEHLSDFSLPYSEENLPHAVSGDLKRRQFLEYQNYVLTDHAHDLEKEGGEHQNIEGNADGFFMKERELGSGGFGEVDEVVSYLSIKHYARKRFGRGRSFRKDQVSIKNFENELQILKKLSHRHLVKLIGSYTDRSWVGIIMTPVADMDLFTYLDADRVSPRDKQDRQICLRRFFGCLATALRYLHGEEIRHKDIKPKNILVKNREVFLADFGTSHNWSDDTRSTTEGTARGFTPRYCAPEVAHHGVSCLSTACGDHS
jgi:serine/threonine protein kinase